jgi:hypothetical protein
MRIATPVPPSAPARRERTPSLPEMPIAVDSGPHQLDRAQAEMPPQSVLDALPAPVPLPPLPIAHAPELHAPPRLPTPPSLRQPPLPIEFAPPPLAAGEEVVSLRRGMSKTRLLLTLAALGGAGSAIWYFLLR